MSCYVRLHIDYSMNRFISIISSDGNRLYDHQGHQEVRYSFLQAVGLGVHSPHESSPANSLLRFSGNYQTTWNPTAH
jgi:hypothetical protein